MKKLFDNKLLINLYVLSLGKRFEVYIPVNEKIGNISRLLNATMFETSDDKKNYILFNAESGISYNNNDLIRDTDIKNNTKLILI